jgi:hypothetical protein
MLCDALSLVDVFATIRNLCMENYKLDPAHFLTAIFRLGCHVEIIWSEIASDN